MKKTISIISVIIVLLAICLGTAVFLTVKLVNPDYFKDQISKIVYAKTGRQLTINGNIGWSFFPWLGVKTYDVSLNNSRNFSNTRFATIGELDIQVKILPLFFGNVSVEKLILKNSNLSLIENEVGKNNWVDLVTTLTTPSVPAATTGQPMQLDISNINVANANIYIENHRTNQNITLNKVFLQGKGINTEGKSFPIDLRANLQSSLPSVSGNIILRGDVVLDIKHKIYAMHNLHSEGLISQAPYLLKSIPFGANADVQTNLDKQTLEINKFTFNLANVNASGNLLATNILFAPLVKGNIQSNAFDPKTLLIAFGVLPQDMAAKKLSEFKIASFKATLQTTSKFLKIPSLELRLDDSLLSGQANYSHFLYKYLVFNLDLNNFDYDRYAKLFTPAIGTKTPVKSGSIKPVKIASHNNPHNNTKISNFNTSMPITSSLRLLKMDGDLRIRYLKLAKMHFNNITTEVTGDFGKIDFSPVTFDFYNGKAQGSVNLDVQKNAPSLTIINNINGLNIQPLFADLTQTNKIIGKANLTSKITTKGNTKESMLNNLNGTGKVAINNGMFYGIDVNYIVDKAKAVLSHKTADTIQATQPPHTSFQSLTSNFNIKNGILYSNNLLVKAGEFAIKGSGSINLIKLTIDFVLETSAKNMKFQVPIKVSNTLLEPNIVPDLSGVMSNILQNNLPQNIKEQITTEGKGDKKTIKIKLNKINDLLHL